MYGHIPAVQAAFDFLKPAVVAIIVGAILKKRGAGIGQERSCVVDAVVIV